MTDEVHTYMKLTEEDIVIDDCWEFSKNVGILIQCGEHNKKEAEQLKQQILANQEIVDRLKAEIDWREVKLDSSNPSSLSVSSIFQIAAEYKLFKAVLEPKT